MPRARSSPRLQIVVALVLAAVLAAPAWADDAFQPGCTLPWAPIAKHRPIDATCAAEGTTASAPHRAQNRAKNELCAAGVPVDVTFTAFKRLQKAVEDQDIPFGSSNKLPPDRAALCSLHTLPSRKRIGEGSLVRYVAFYPYPTWLAVA